MVLGGMVLAMVVFFLFVRTTCSVRSGGCHLATRTLSRGDLEHRIEVRSQDEIGELSQSFNQMARTASRETSGRSSKAMTELERRNEELRVINRNYMEMLGFVSHELKAPFGSAVLGVYTVKDGYLGPVSDAQQRILGERGTEPRVPERDDQALSRSFASRKGRGPGQQAAGRSQQRNHRACSSKGLMASIEAKAIRVRNQSPARFPPLLRSCTHAHRL